MNQMSKSKGKINSIDKYNATFPENVQEILQKLRKTNQESTPDAEQTISYQVPTSKLNGNLT